MIPTINLLGKFELVNKYWTPMIIGELNGQMVKIAKLKGDFIWHDHKNEDELFYVVKGTLTIEFRDHTTVLNKGDMIIVPKGVEHKPSTPENEEVWVMLFEPKETKHTGDVIHERTVTNLDRI